MIISNKDLKILKKSISQWYFHLSSIQLFLVHSFILLSVKFLKILITSLHTPKPCYLPQLSACSLIYMNISIKIFLILEVIHENFIDLQRFGFKHSQQSFWRKFFYALIRWLSLLFSQFIWFTLIEDLRHLKIINLKNLKMNLERISEKSSSKKYFRNFDDLIRRSKNLKKDYFSMIFHPIIEAIYFSTFFYF